MSYSQPASTSGRGRRGTRSAILAVLVVLSAALLVNLGYPHLAASLSLQSDHPGRLGVSDGEVPDGVTVMDDEYPAVANLDPALHDALRRAARDASSDGVDFYVNSGWRTRRYQEHLLDQAVAEYGTRNEAARWVATADTSPHVSGDAVDLGPYAATSWLSQHGAGYGLCQIYGNEPWHYEFRPKAVDQGCPPTYADPTYDPRMQQ